ncbi:MAG: hypothetical protein HRT88_19870, partial [Lentisphaeraceae bacterium]|nr:hypothetical protein [Lentisphaeraceae bacterium]
MKKILFLFLLLLLLSPVLCGADLTLSGGTVRLGSGMYMGQENWGRVYFNLKNSSSRTRDVKIVFRHSSQPAGVYEYKITIQPKQRIQHHFAVALGEVSHSMSKKGKRKNPRAYTLALLEKKGDDYRPVQGQRAIECNMLLRNFNNTPSFVFLTDDRNTVGNLSKTITGQDSLYRSTSLTAAQWPQHWSEYSVFDAVIVQQPKFSLVNSLAVQALKDYVNFGGTLIFLNPEGIMQADESLLSDLLPVTPIKTRQVNKISGLSKVPGYSPIRSAAEMTLVEALPKENSITEASWKGFPLISWKKQGLGICGFMAFSPFDESLSQEALKKTWQYLMQYSGRPLDMAQLKTANSLEVVNMLNGLRIPPASTILTYLLIYLALAMVIFFVLIKLKKPAAAWILNTVVALAFSAFILNKAYSSKSDTGDNKTAAVLIQIPYLPDGPSVKIYSVFSKNDEVVTFKNDAINTRFRPLVKVQRSFRQGDAARNIASKSVQQILRSDYADGQSSLKNMKLQGLSSRAFVALERSDITEDFSAVLNLQNSNLSIELSAIPQELQTAGNIYLLGPGGVLSLELIEGELRARASQNEHGTLDGQMRQILKGLKTKRPVLAFTVKSLQKDDLLDDSYTLNSLKLYM